MNWKNLFLVLFIYWAYIFCPSQQLHAQSSGFIVIKSIPTGAEVFINGISTLKKTPFQLKVEEGTYQVTLKYDLYNEYSETIRIVKGQTFTKEFALKPAYGDIKLTSEPSEADIKLDGVAVNQKTPATLKRVPSGKHIISLSKDMYSETVEEISVSDEQTLEKFLELEANYGTLGIVVRPDARISIDDSIQKSGSPFFRLTPGIHKIVLSKEKFYPYEKEISVIKGQEEKLNIQLKPIVGSLSVMVDPPETEIFLNDKYFGISPRILDSLSIGEYNLELKKGDYATFRKKILIEENNTLQIDTVLFKGKLVKITSSPAGADVIHDGKTVGITPADIVFKDGPNNIILSKKYYADLPLTINVQKNDQVFDFNLNMSKTLLNVSVETYPSRADINLNETGMAEKSSGSENNLFNYSGKTPCSVQVPRGKLDIKLGKKGYKTIEKELALEKPQNFEINLEPIKYRTKGNAVLLSILWPGAGQSYLHRGSAHFLMGFAGYGFLAGAIIEAQRYNENTDPDLFSQYLMMRNTFLISAGAVWATNLIWTILAPSEKQKYEKLNLKFGYNKQLGIKEWGVKINF